MLDKLLSVVATNAKLVVAGAVGAALVAGGGAVAIQQVSDSTPSSVSTEVRGGDPLGTGAENRSDTATANIAPKPPKPPKTDDGDPADGAKDNHGACVSAAAHAAVPADAAPNARGKAVSAIAKSDCGKKVKDADKAVKADADGETEAAEPSDEDGTEAAEPKDDESAGGSAGSSKQSGKSGGRGKR